MEARGGSVIRQIVDTKKYIQERDHDSIRKAIHDITQSLQDIEKIIMRMYEHCTPDDFWNFRFYFEGTNDVNRFPKGLRVKGVDHDPIVFSGISAAQSTMIQAFDSFFSVEHEGHGKEFLDRMKLYMPPKHKKFLEDYSGDKLGLRKYLEEAGDQELMNLFNEGIAQFAVYRQGHLKLVHDYVVRIVQARKEASEAAQGGAKLYKTDFLGTGGTDAQSLLSKLISETRKMIFWKTKKSSIVKKEQKVGKENVKPKNGINRQKITDTVISLMVGAVGVYVTKVCMDTLVS